MKLYQSRTLLCFALSCAFATLGAAQERGKRGTPPPGPPPAQAGTYTTVSGAITQLNYDREGEVEGFLLSNGALIHLPPRAAAHVGTAVRTGDNVQITGYSQKTAAGIQTVEAQSVQDKTSGKTFAIPQPGPGAPYSGSGRIQQLNYGPDGAINGFLFDNGVLATAPPFGAMNPSSLRVGATISYAGYARTTISGRTVVDVQTVTINGQSLLLSGRDPRGQPGTPPAPVGPPARPGEPGRPAGVMTPPAPPQPADPRPPGRSDEPAPPPPPPAPPQS